MAGISTSAKQGDLTAFCNNVASFGNAVNAIAEKTAQVQNLFVFLVFLFIANQVEFIKVHILMKTLGFSLYRVKDTQ